jgi:hypothetical protein
VNKLLLAHTLRTVRVAVGIPRDGLRERIASGNAVVERIVGQLPALVAYGVDYVLKLLALLVVELDQCNALLHLVETRHHAAVLI